VSALARVFDISANYRCASQAVIAIARDLVGVTGDVIPEALGLLLVLMWSRAPSASNWT
jgi:hypothetical protein